MNVEKIKALIGKHHARAAEIRRRIHRRPEPGFREHETAALIARTLEGLGVRTRTGVAGTGVVGLVEGARPGRTVLLRADMDALEMTEETGLDYASEIPGLMHACGHDGHVAGLLLCAMALSEMRDEMSGCVKLMFQPAEETEGGALPMIEAGVLDDPKVDAAFGCHLWGGAREGTVLVKSGPIMAAPDDFRIKIVGSGGHGAMPHLTADPISIAAQAICAFQSIVSRRKNPLEPAVVSVCAINGGTVHNIIPDSVSMIGTVRTFDEGLRDSIPRAMEGVVAAIAGANGGGYEFELLPKYPALVNDARMTDLVERAAAKIVGSENVERAKEPSMGGEDFAYLCQRVPSSFFFAGISRDPENPVLHHSPKFAWDDGVLRVSAGVLCQAALDFLEG